MPVYNSYWNRLFGKLRGIYAALTGGSPVIDGGYGNVCSVFWKRLFEKLDSIIVAIVEYKANYEELSNKPAIGGITLDKDSDAAGLGLETASLPYKGAQNQAGILVDLGMDAPGGAEILFDILYNETQGGILKRQSRIHGQFYGDLGPRTGMVQNGNVPVPVFAFRGTAEGRGNTNIYMWIPNSNTGCFPSARAEAWHQNGSGNFFDKFPATISTLAADPAETMTEITDMTP
jgi:hypothetical protein